MSRQGFPSMAALLGLLAVAGYQNRDKIAELLRGPPGGEPMGAPQDGSGSRGAASGGGLGGALSELLERFTQSGDGDVARSWVGTGPNREIAPDRLERSLGPDLIRTLSEKTGLPADELLQRLSRDLPDAVDRYTPEGRLPA